MSKRQQWLTVGAIGVVVFFAAVLVLQQDSPKKTKVLGEQIQRSTTTGATNQIPGLISSTTTTSSPATTTTTTAQVVQPPATTIRARRPATTVTILVTRLVPPVIPQPTVGPATLNTQNVMTIDTANGTVASSEVLDRSQTDVSTFLMGANAPQGSTFRIEFSIANKTDHVFSLGSNPQISVLNDSGNSTTTLFTIPLGSTNAIQPFQQLTVSENVSLGAGTYSLHGSLAGAWL